MGFLAGSLSFVDENEAVKRILQVSAEMRLSWAIPRHSVVNASLTLWRAPHQSTGMMQNNHLLQFGATCIYLWEFLRHREKVLSVMRIVFSESVVFHLVSWVPSTVVFFWVVFVFGVCFVSTLEDIWLFAFHLFSNNVRIVDRPQDVLMTVRASNVHCMS